MKKNIVLLFLLLIPFYQCSAMEQAQQQFYQNFDQSTLWKVVACLGVGLFVLDKSIPLLWNYLYGTSSTSQTTAAEVDKYKNCVNKTEFESEKKLLQKSIGDVSSALDSCRDELALSNSALQKNITQVSAALEEHKKEKIGSRYVLKKTWEKDKENLIASLQSLEEEKVNPISEKMKLFEELLVRYKNISAQLKRFKKKLKSLKNEAISLNSGQTIPLTAESGDQSAYNSDEDNSEFDIKEGSELPEPIAHDTTDRFYFDYENQN